MRLERGWCYLLVRFYDFLIGGFFVWVNKERNMILELFNYKRWIKEDLFLFYKCIIIVSIRNN